MSQQGTVTPVASQPSVTVKPVLKINGAPQLQKAEAPAAPSPAAPTVDFAAETAKLKAGMDELQKQARRHAVERQKLSEERKAHQKALEDTKKWQSQRELFKLNPDAFLRQELGDAYYDQLTNLRLSGGAPPAQIVAAEIQKLKDDFAKQLAERDSASQAAQQTAAKQRVESTRRQLQAEAQEYVKASAKEHGILAALGDEAGLGKILANKIEAVYNESERRDSASGELLVPGKVLSAREAADLVEQEIVSLVEKVTATEKWKSRSTQTAQSQQRRTLNNSATGRTPGRSPPISDEERRERAQEAWNRSHARNQTA